MTTEESGAAPRLEVLRALFERQQAASRAQEPIDHARRVAALDALLLGILAHEERLVAAVEADFGHRPAHETRLLEIVPLVDEIRDIRRHLRRWMRPRPVRVNWQGPMQLDCGNCLY